MTSRPPAAVTVSRPGVGVEHVVEMGRGRGQLVVPGPGRQVHHLDLADPAGAQVLRLAGSLRRLDVDDDGGGGERFVRLPEVDTFAAGDDVDAHAGPQPVVACAAVDGVVAVAGAKLVVPRAQRHVEGVDAEEVDPVLLVAAVVAVMDVAIVAVRPEREGRRDHVVGQVRPVDDQQVRARARIDPVAPAGDGDRVVAAVGRDVVEPAGVQRGDGVGACARGEPLGQVVDAEGFHVRDRAGNRADRIARRDVVQVDGHASGRG